MLQAFKAALHHLIKSCRRTGCFHYICSFSHMDNASALPAYINVTRGPKLLPRKCFFNCWQMPWRVRYGGQEGGSPFFSCADTISFSRSSSHKFGPDPRRHLRQMMRGCKLCIPLIRLFLPPSLSCTPSFTAATYGRQLCREPQSVFTARRTLSHTAAQMLDQRGARLQPACLWPHFFFSSAPGLFLHHCCCCCCCMLLFSSTRVNC